MKVMITGAQFMNKGAQSLLYSVVSELKTRYENIVIYYVPLDNYKNYNPDMYRFAITYDDKSYLDRKFNIKLLLKGYVRCLFNSLKISIKYKKRHIERYSKTIREIDALIDVSGFVLSDKFAYQGNYRLLRYVEDAKKNNAKVILMPQSFGPFNYKSEKGHIDHKIREVLPKADLIFAREREGKSLLENEYALNNVELSIDTVLQAKVCKESAVMTKKVSRDLPAILKEHNIGIIPNVQTVKHGDENEVLRKYKAIIDKLISLRKNIYIINHSNDFELCEKIYTMFGEDEHVHLISKEMDCIEYGEIVRNFEYIIASRYHAIVHAYKEYVPAIILGWAIKYFDLAEVFGQSGYVYDLNTCKINEIIDAIDTMDKLVTEEKEKIRTFREKTMHDTCFDKCWTILDELYVH